MRDRPIRLLELFGDPIHMGHLHGAAFPNEIRRYADDRTDIVGSGTWSGRPATRDDALELAERMLPAHEEYAPDLHEEMVSMAEAAGITPAEAVIVGGFTDFVDTVRALGHSELPIEDDCTAVVVPDHRARGAGYLAQTWDMHDSATEHVVMLHVLPDAGIPALVYSTVGCLGQIGMNAAGIAVGINNLVASNGKVGVTWPFVVRKALQQPTFETAVDAIVGADVAGAHSFLVFAADGQACMIEAMPDRHEVIPLGSDVLVHTNHCLLPSTVEVEAERPDDLQESSKDRLVRAAGLLAEGEVDLDRLIDLTRDPESICRISKPPHHVETCGAAIMRPRTGEFWACWGLPSDNDYERFELEVSDA